MREIYYIEIGHQRVSYQIIRTGRKRTVGIEMTPQNGILVRAPRRLRRDHIREILSDRSEWIRERLELFREKGGTSTAHTFDSGDRFLFLGSWHKLERFLISAGPVSVSRTDGCLKVLVPEETPDGDRGPCVRAALAQWYRHQAGFILPERVTAYATHLRLPVPPVRIGNARRTWGSCGAKGTLSFSWRVIMAQISLVDYVVVHELCHLKRRDHSRAFWGLVGSILPDYANRREQLQLEGHLYDF